MLGKHFSVVQSQNGFLIFECLALQEACPVQYRRNDEQFFRAWMRIAGIHSKVIEVVFLWDCHFKADGKKINNHILLVEKRENNSLASEYGISSHIFFPHVGIAFSQKSQLLVTVFQFLWLSVVELSRVEANAEFVIIQSDFFQVPFGINGFGTPYSRLKRLENFG